MITRKYKGHCVNYLPSDYTVIDIETNGFFASQCEILEISAIKYRNDQKIDTYSTLIKPTCKINPFITKLTGITDTLASNGKDIFTALNEFSQFIQNEIIVGYNVNFDINFLYDNLATYHNKLLTNNYLDVLRLTRKYLPQLNNHKQTTVANYLGIDIKGAHRAEKDCLICATVYQYLRNLYIK